MGVVNVTPDSFWDGGRYLETDAAVRHAEELVAQGADIVDVGGESTRPGAAPVQAEEELHRVLPVLERIAGRLKVPISIDTMKVEVARAAVGRGASIINDVRANRQDPAMWRLAAETGAAYVCMHMQGTPEDMQRQPRYQDVVGEVECFFGARLEQLRDCGLGPDQTILDPGIGFGKSLEHNLALLGSMNRFARFGRPLLVGVSRKSFIGNLLGGEPAERLPGALACACLAVEAGVQIIRAHDVAATVQAVRMAEAILERRKK
jgi:dihydropteroate synthase